MRALFVLLPATLALAACDPAGPATVRLIPVGGEGAVSGDGAPLDALRTDASPIASTDAMVAEPPVELEEGSADDLAAATTAAIGGSAGSSAPTDTSALTAYATSATNPPGTALYQRDFASTERASRACARYGDNNQAQAAFLAAGGPAQDPRGLDPDGDGYACGWDPLTYQGKSAG
ncbi:MAG: hypothetical protein AAGF94_08695 [Pseudomonadota bacterium]